MKKFLDLIENGGTFVPISRLVKNPKCMVPVTTDYQIQCGYRLPLVTSFWAPNFTHDSRAHENRSDKKKITKLMTVLSHFLIYLIYLKSFLCLARFIPASDFSLRKSISSSFDDNETVNFSIISFKAIFS